MGRYLFILDSPDNQHHVMLADDPGDFAYQGKRLEQGAASPSHIASVDPIGKRAAGSWSYRSRSPWAQVAVHRHEPHVARPRSGASYGPRPRGARVHQPGAARG